MFVAKKVFLTQGVGRHREKLTSFEMALRDAGIADQNLVRVSSIFPPHCRIIPRKEGVKKLRSGAVTFVVMSENATHTPTNPARLPSTRTPNTTRAKAKRQPRMNSDSSVVLTARPPSRTARDSGAARSRFHIPSFRCSSRPTPISIATKRMNWTPIPAKE